LSRSSVERLNVSRDVSPDAKLQMTEIKEVTASGITVISQSPDTPGIGFNYMRGVCTFSASGGDEQ